MPHNPLSHHPSSLPQVSLTVGVGGAWLDAIAHRHPLSVQNALGRMRSGEESARAMMPILPPSLPPSPCSAPSALLFSIHHFGRGFLTSKLSLTSHNNVWREGCENPRIKPASYFSVTLWSKYSVGRSTQRPKYLYMCMLILSWEQFY